jgi:hypothetical protein
MLGECIEQQLLPLRRDVDLLWHCHRTFVTWEDVMVLLSHRLSSEKLFDTAVVHL